MSLRKLKHHEQKLLRKVDFLQWKSDDNLREVAVLRRYHIQRREDYMMYNRVLGNITQLVTKLKQLDAADEYRIRVTTQLLEKLYNMALINNKRSLALCEEITASSFCRRRLPIVLVRLHMAEHVSQAVKLVEQGHVRVGPMTVTDPAYLVSRSMEDWVTWVDGSKIQATIQKYNDKLDDYALLGN